MMEKSLHVRIHDSSIFSSKHVHYTHGATTIITLLPTHQKLANVLGMLGIAS